MTARLTDRYGRKIGYVKLLCSRVGNALGRYAGYRAIRWHDVQRLVFVCHGNICRSAYAEARARSLGLNAVSAGIGATKGVPADKVAMLVAAARDIDLQSHRTTHVSDLKTADGDLFLCMEPAQAEYLVAIGVTTSQQVTLLGLWASEERPFLQDPYGLSEGYWNTCFDFIDAAIDSIGHMISRGARTAGWTDSKNTAINVMVAGAHSMGALGAIRSLGRGGYIVHAVASAPDAIGLHSNFARHRVIEPSVNDSSFAAWVEAYVRQHDIRMIIPGGAIGPSGHVVFRNYNHLFPVPDDAAIRAKSSKFDLFENLLSGGPEHRANLPPVMLVDLTGTLPTIEQLAALSSPIFVKLDGIYSRSRSGDQVMRFCSPEKARAGLEKLASTYSKAVVQGYVEGVGVGAFFLYWNGQFRARFMHRRLHEMPHTGGASSFRESWWHETVLADAESKLKRIGWNGVAMVEYRWDSKTDKFYLMEMNLRFWGSIHLALYSGVDFPKLLADAFFDRPPAAPPKPLIGVRCRNTIPFEFGYLVSLWRDTAVGFRRKLFSLWEAVALTLDWRIKNDLLFPGDRQLFWYRLWRFLRTGR